MLLMLIGDCAVNSSEWLVFIDVSGFKVGFLFDFLSTKCRKVVNCVLKWNF